MGYKTEIENRLRGKYHLKPIFQSVYGIPERLKEYDPNFFLVFNTRTQKYEIHSLENPFSTFCLTLPYDQLDVRSLRHLWKNDIRMHGKEIFNQIEKAERMQMLAQKREFSNWARDVAKETQSLMAKTAWT